MVIHAGRVTDPVGAGRTEGDRAARCQPTPERGVGSDPLLHENLARLV